MKLQKDFQIGHLHDKDESTENEIVGMMLDLDQ
jgi:hypothetical protein